MRRKNFLRVCSCVVAFLLIVIIFFVANLFLGNPILAKIAKNKGKEYINDKYSHLDLKIEEVIYNPKDGSYGIFITSDTSEDTYFSLSYRNKEIFRDDYEISVLSGMNTIDRFCNEYEKRLTLLVQNKTKNITNISVIPEKLIKYDIELDSDFDKNLIEDVKIIIRSTGGTDAKHLSKMLKLTYDVMRENGYIAAGFGITGEQEMAITELQNIKPTHIEDEKLEEIIQKAIEDTEYEGIISFSKG